MGRPPLPQSQGFIVNSEPQTWGGLLGDITEPETQGAASGKKREKEREREGERDGQEQRLFEEAEYEVQKKKIKG